MDLDLHTDHESIVVNGKTITRGDIVTVGSSKIARRVMAISDNHGLRLVRIDGEYVAYSVWTKQYHRIKVVAA